MKHGKTPRLSIGLPVYNGETFIDECIRSIVSQTFTDFELIVCDNASTDGTPEIVRRWSRTDSRVSLHRADANRGAAANFNWAYELGTGEYFKWCAVDDLMDPDCVRACVEALDRAPDAVLAYPGALDIDQSGTVIGEIYDNRIDYAFGDADPAKRFRDLICHPHSCVSVFGVIRRSALERSSLIGPYPASDIVLLAELGLQGRFVRVPENLLLHRQHARRSVTEHPKLRDRMPWFNPAHRGLVFPHFRLMREYLRAALSSGLPIADRLRCVPQVARWIRWGGWHGLADDALFYMRRPPASSRKPA